MFGSEQLNRATDRMFLCGVGDVAEELCRSNMTLGLEKIHHVEAELGLPPTACFIGTPDATVTRNVSRWRAGFGYGGLVCWHPELFILDAKPNGCGMLVGALPAPAEEARVRAAAEQARRAPPRLEGIELRYDLGESNHFVDGLELEQVLAPGESAPEHLFIIHSSGHEHRASSSFGPGLYLDESPALQRLARPVETPLGPLHVLEGDQARAYHQQCLEVQRFNARRRELFGELLFGPHQVIANVMHQGMRAPGELLLGAYHADPGGLFPLTLGPERPVYLVRARPSFSDQAMDRLRWQHAATRTGLLGRLRSANLLPHGGGYRFPGFDRLLWVELPGEQPLFQLEPAGGGAPVAVDDVRALPFAFRGEEVLERVVELGLGEPVARYRISFVIKD